MARRSEFAPLSDAELTPEQLEFTKKLRVNGIIPNGFRVGMRSWKLFKAHLPFSSYVMALSSVPARLRELAIIRISHLNNCDYEFEHHSQFGLNRLGFTQQDIDSICEGAGAAGLSDLDSYVIRLVDQLREPNGVSDDVVDKLMDELGEDSFTELMFTIGNYESMTRIINVLGVPMDEDFDAIHKHNLQ